jgi:CheY-like chemotaxis protein
MRGISLAVNNTETWLNFTLAVSGGPKAMPCKRILVVDDEALVGQAIRFALFPEGYEIDVVTSPFEALRKTTAGSYDLILTDYKMAGMTGVELVKRPSAAAR